MSIERRRLDNGLGVLMLTDHSAPVIAYQTWFAVGSRHEQQGKTGIAHLFEHLMFNETENLPPGEFDRLLEEAGAESNAATFLDWTYYMENLPSDALELVIRLESERMQHLVLRDPQVASEREVVANERRQTVDDDVDGSVAEQLYRTAFEAHSYGHTTIGSMEDIRGLTTADCRSFYGTYYAPNNAVLVVVGDFEPERLVDLLDRHYGSIAAAELPIERTSVEPPQTAERRLRVRKPSDVAKVAMGYKSPAMAHADHAPLVLLNEVLFGGMGSRAHRRLVKELELASEAHGYLGNFRDPSLWDIYLTARTPHAPATLVHAIDEIFAEVTAAPVDEEELARARARIELGTLQGLDTAVGKAEQIGFAETVLGDPAAIFTRLARYAAVDADEVLRVARSYLDPARRTVIEVLTDRDPGAGAAAAEVTS